jgi:hypothetical protein
MLPQHPKSGRWRLARWKPGDGPLHTLFCGVPTCSGILGYGAPYRTRTAVLEPQHPAKGLDGMTAHVFLAPSLRQVDGTEPPIFEVGRHAQRSPGHKPRRRAGVLSPDGKIDSVVAPSGANGRYMVCETPIVTELPRFVITGSGAAIVHKNTLPIIVQCPKVAAHRSEIREPVEEIDWE